MRCLSLLSCLAPLSCTILLSCTGKAEESGVPDAGDDRIEGTEPGDCSDGADNDADGEFDCDDSGCEGSPDCEEGTGDGGTGTDNAAPELSVTLSPVDPQTDDPLRAVVDASDADGDTLTLTHAWTVDGVEVGGDSNTLDGSAWFDKGQQVAVTVTVSDGTDQTSATAGPVVVANTPPGGPAVALQPAEPGGGDDLVCVVEVEADDPDGDGLTYTVTWQVDGASWSGATATATWPGDTIDSEHTAGDQVWTCTATPHDGDDDGAPASASATVSGFTGWASPTVSAADADYIFDGVAAVDIAGSQTAGGDFDGDGLADLVFGARLADPNGTDSGEVYVFFAANLGPPGTYSADDADVVLVGSTGGDGAGLGIATADLDGDGLDDLIVGGNAATSASSRGRTWIVLGSTLASAGSPFDLSGADIIITGDDVNDYARLPAVAGDVDGDGLDDLLVGAWGVDDGASSGGAAALFLATTLTSSSSHRFGDADYLLRGDAAGSGCGKYAGSAGDVDGDGLDDVLVGCFRHSSNTGRAYLVRAADLPSTGAYDLGDVATACYAGDHSSAYLGIAVGSLGDIDGDALDDWFVGGGGVGALYAYLAGDLTSSSACRSASAGASATISAAASGDNFGVQTIVSDVDGDGLPDLLSASYSASPPRVDLFLNYDATTASLPAAAADWSFEAEHDGDELGAGMHPLGDVNGDGLDDLLLGAAGNDEIDPDAGRVYLFLTP